MTSQYTTTKPKFFPMYTCTFPEPLSSLVPGVPMFCGEDTHRVLSRSGDSSQDTVELFHYVTTRDWGQTTTWDFIQNIQLNKTCGGGGSRVVGGVEGKDELRRQHRNKKKDWKNISSVPIESSGSLNIFSRTSWNNYTV